MTRYGWSRQESYQPYPAGTVPYVTDQDFTYITSEDLNPYPDINPRNSAPSLAPSIDPEYEADDVLHISLDGRDLQLQFPAYSIGDGKLYVRDVQSRIAFLQGIEEHRIPHIQLYYKGRFLSNPNQLVRAYGCKNNSALACEIPDRPYDSFPVERELRERELEKQRERRREFDRYRDSAVGSGSDSETVVVTDDHGRVVTSRRPSRRKSTVKHSGSSSYHLNTQHSPRSSGTNVNIFPSPTTMGNSSSKRSGSRPSESPAMKKLTELEEHFNAHLKPLFEDFAASPPADQQKREEEHKRLEEITMQQVLLKCDEVETDGDEEIRMRRKALVRYVQEYLKVIDGKK